MTPPKKPDWIEIADNDGGSNNLAPVAKKSRPLVVAIAALTLTFGGAVVAQINQVGSGDFQQSSQVQASQSAAIATPANNQEFKTQGGRSPKRRLRKVPPESDATAAINAMPP